MTDSFPKTAPNLHSIPHTLFFPSAVEIRNRLLEYPFSASVVIWGFSVRKLSTIQTLSGVCQRSDTSITRHSHHRYIRDCTSNSKIKKRSIYTLETALLRSLLRAKMQVCSYYLSGCSSYLRRYGYFYEATKFFRLRVKQAEISRYMYV